MTVVFTRAKAVAAAVLLISSLAVSMATAVAPRLPTASWVSCGNTTISGVYIPPGAITPSTSSLALGVSRSAITYAVAHWTRRTDHPCGFTYTTTTVNYDSTIAPKTSTRLTIVKPRPWVSCGPATIGNVTFGQIGSTVANLITVDQSVGSYAVVTLWTRQHDQKCRFTKVFAETGRIGANGTVEGTKRVQDTATTPRGVYTMTTSFGNGSKPATPMAWRSTTVYDYWVQDNESAYYNSYRTAQQGGFRASESEHLVDFGAQYRYAAVINYNMPPNAVRYRGAGIFLHVTNGRPTAGCVAISQASMLRVMNAIKPGDLIGIRG